MLIAHLSVEKQHGGPNNAIISHHFTVSRISKLTSYNGIVHEVEEEAIGIKS